MLFLLVPAATLYPVDFALSNEATALSQTIDTDLLIVGGTESGCAAAVQAARMGVASITLVNDINWLGGQFSAEGLCAVDENRARSGTNKRPFPRSGLFKELMDEIESVNLKKYGHKQPGNGAVLTSCLPADAEALFRKMIQPYVASGQIRIISGFYPVAAELAKDGKTLRQISFRSTSDDQETFSVRAGMTIDASDWGEVIQAAGAEFECGPDLKEKYGEPHAPTDADAYPPTEMNPITWCMIVEETDEDQLIEKPAGYDERCYYLSTRATQAEYEKLSWSHPPHRGFASPNSVYFSRRLIDHRQRATLPGLRDVVLLNWTTQNYPLDRLPQRIVEKLEQLEPGASRKNIVRLTRDQRQLIFDDAKRHALGLLYHLQTTVHERMQDKTFSLRRFQLTDLFGTADRLPPKPYIRESLRLKAMYMMREQETLRQRNKDQFARVMCHDGIACWQFEYDFHPTGRGFLPAEGPAGPWEAYGKKGRGWGIYSNRSLFPLRSLVPVRVDGLLGAQKNLGYSSIVSSAVRLHDQSMAIGQAAGAAAAVCLKRKVQPRRIPFDPTMLTAVRVGLCADANSDAIHKGGIPLCLWPFRDLSPIDESFASVNLLAVSGMLPLNRQEVDFRPHEPATKKWRQEIVNLSLSRKQVTKTLVVPTAAMTRGQFALAWWKLIHPLSDQPWERKKPDDADADGILDLNDPLPLDPNNASLPDLPGKPLAAHEDGLPDPLSDSLPTVDGSVRRFNFTGAETPSPKGFTNDVGERFDSERGFGWQRDLTGNNRRRGQFREIERDTFLFTRGFDHWECSVENGKYFVTICVGDSSFQQVDQRVAVEGAVVVDDQTTQAGRFYENSLRVEVSDGRLRVELGKPNRKANTCLNWLRIVRLRE